MNSSLPRKIAVFGATGTIGASTMNVLKASQEPFTLATLVGNKNIETMRDLALQFKPLKIGMHDQKSAKILKDALHTLLPSCQVFGGHDELLKLASEPYDWALMGISGLYHALPILTKLLSSTTILALANKECLVCSGEHLLETARLHNTTIIPVDSEHNGIFQLLSQPHQFHSITLTASGGACRDMPLEELFHASPQQVLNHPVWPMGDKITVDSATMVNKGLEIIEASMLFRLPEDRIHVLLHRESIVHALVHYPDGTQTAMLSNPNMQIAIAHSFAYPKRMTLPLKNLDLSQHTLSFSKPNHERYPALDLARKASRHGAALRTAYWVASDVTAHAFLEQLIPFGAITPSIQSTMEHHITQKHPLNPQETLALAHEVAHTARNIIEKYSYSSLHAQ